jgi:L-malate glycosyltransferase
MTSVYPSPNDDKNVSITPVVHYFAKQWVLMGHEVIVIYNANRYPDFLKFIPRKIKNTLMSKFSFVPLVNDNEGDIHYLLDNVKVYRYPMLKIIPRGLFFKNQIKNQNNKIIETLDKSRFKPDLIINHWDNPQIQLSSLIKNHYKAKNVLVFHGLGNLKSKLKGKVLKESLKNVNIVGFRSLEMQNEFHRLFGKFKREFICYSGIPDDYVINNKHTSKKSFNRKVYKYLYVGSLIKRKNPDTIIKALAKLKNQENFEFNIVGEGPMKKELEELSKQLGVAENIHFLGRVSREEVIQLMQESECFTMVSNNEVFGLVYLEAMLQGCIVICSRNEGFDGIIKDGDNGFVCDAGNVEELVSIYSKIDLMDNDIKSSLSDRAKKTAEYYTDSQVAKDYLNNINY